MDDVGFHPASGTEAGSIRADRLARFRLACAAQGEAVISISSYHRAGESRGESLRRLNAAWVDCDCGPEKVGTNGLDYPDAVRLMLELEARGVWPKASAFVFSGDGAWALWLLHDAPREHRPELGVWAGYWLKREHHKQVNQALARAAYNVHPELRPDLGAVDPTRHIRVDGSIHGGTGARVEYLWRTDDTLDVPAYTLDNLAWRLGVVLKEKRRPKKKTGRKHKADHQGRFQTYLGELETILAARGQIHESEPSREEMIRLYCYLLAMVGKGLRECIDKGRYLAAHRCRPPLPRLRADAMARAGHGYAKRVRDPQDGALPRRNAEMARALGVSVAEADRLGIEKLRPDFGTEPKTNPRKLRTEARRAALQAVLADLGETGWTERNLKARLGALGHSACRKTLRRDLRTLGVRPEGGS